MTWIDRWIASVAPVAAKAASVSRGGIEEARPEVRVSTTVCATPGSVSSRAERRGGGGEGRHARRHRVGDAERVEPADLLAHRAPDRQIARMQPRDVLPRVMRGDDLGHDGVERRAARCSTIARTRRAVRQDLRRGTSEPA